MKQCFKCKELKLLSEFYKHSGFSDGYLNKCKVCAIKDAKESRLKRKQYYDAYDRVRASLPHRKSANKARSKRDTLEGKNQESKRKSAIKHKDRKDANTKVGNAVRDGRLIKHPCFICGCSDVEAHHPDYSAPLDVVWLCVEHHKECHRLYDREEDKLLLGTQPKGSRWDVIKEEEVNSSVD